MVKEYNYVNIREVLSRLHRNPLLLGTDLELAVQYTIDFIGIFGLPRLYQDKLEELEIKNYRAMLPCDLISIIQVKDCKTDRCLSSNTDSFNPRDCDEYNRLTFKTQGQILFTSFKEGRVLLSYKAIPVDDEGYPLLLDDSNFLKTLECYIKKEVYTELFELGKINIAVLQHIELQYAWLAGLLLNEFTLPSVSEMESITRMWNTLIPRVTEFDNGFKTLGHREYLRNN